MKTKKQKSEKEYKMKCYPGDHPRILVTKEFIERNKLQLCSPEKIKELYVEEAKEDMFGFRGEVYLDHVPFELAKEFLTDEFIKKHEAGENDWIQITDVFEVVQDFLDYMVFAWMKALDEKWISAGRSVEKLGAWLKILGRDDLSKIVNKDSLYNPYGAPALIKVCDELGIYVPRDLVEFAKHKC